MTRPKTFQLNNKDEHSLAYKFCRMTMMQKYLITLSIIFICWTGAFAQATSLRIIEQPKPELPRNYGSLDVQGTAILRVEFLDYGAIGEVTAIKTLPADLTEKAITAAKKIKFEPEIRDGKPVTSFKNLQYYYSWNGGWQVPNETVSAANSPADKEKAEAIIAKAVQTLGGDRYLQVKTQIGRGKFSVIKDGVVASFQTFVDVIVFPDKERTEFKGSGSKTIQTNTGDTGWVFDGDQELVKIQNETQIANFKQSVRTSLDNLLRGKWRADAEISYVGRRAATLGKRNEVIKLTFKDGFVIEFEFATDDGLPQKSIFKTKTADGDELKEEDRYAQFVDIGLIKVPFIIDHVVNGAPSSRINYLSIEVNKNISDSIFQKPSTPKEAKKDLKF